jgi:hypothetical protein
MSYTLASNKGYTITSSGELQFVIPPRSASDILMRVVAGSVNPTTRRYPFKPLDVMMGY